MKKIVFRVLILIILAGGAWWGYKIYRDMPQRQQQVATTRVRRGEVVVRSYARGELRAVRSATLTAPNLFGTVQVTRMAALGAFAREKDLVVEFDDAEVRSRLEEKELELEQTDEQRKKAEADLAIRTNQDQVDLLKAKYAVRRAELEVQRNELISQIDAQKNILSLEEAKRRLKQLESDIVSRQAQAKAQLDVLKEQKNKGLLELAREKQRLSQVKLLAPMSGLVAVRQNRSGYGMMGLQIPDIREGDQVSPGMPVADVLDLSELEVSAKIGELDRANLREAQPVILKLDAVPDKTFTGQIKTLSGTASANVWSGDAGKKFDVTFSVEMKQLLTALGAKPDQIQKVLATAEQNRRRPPLPQSSFSLMMANSGAPGQMPAMPGPMMPGNPAMAGPPGGSAGAKGGPPGPPAGGRSSSGPQTAAGGPGGRPPGGGEKGGDAQKSRSPLERLLGGRKLQDLSKAERDKVLNQIAQGEIKVPDSGSKGDRGGKGGKGGDRQGRPDIPNLANLPTGYTFGSVQFSEKDLEKAKLPPAPEEDDQLEVLLRPGLLADIEIIVDKIPDAIYVPNQAVFEKDGKPVVYVKIGNNFEAREIKPLKRSESLMVISAGVKAGDTIALADPFAKPGGKKQDKSGGAGAMGGVGGTGGGGGR